MFDGISKDIIEQAKASVDAAWHDTETYWDVVNITALAIQAERKRCVDMVGDLVGHAMYHVPSSSKGDDDQVFNDAIHAAQKALSA